MSFLDLFIIYLACGAPFAVYYFLKNRSRSNSISLWLKTLFRFFVWIPFALFLLGQRKSFKSIFDFSFDKTSASDSIQEKPLHSIRKQIEKILLQNKLHVSIYEFRETFDRYVGLTIAIQVDAETISGQEKEIFRAAKMKNIELGSICLSRRNRKRLFTHQTEARKDFLNLINQLVEFDFSKSKLQQQAFELVKILKDFEAQSALERMLADAPQTDIRFNVQNLEKDIWKPEIHISLPNRQISSSIQTMKAAVNLNKKD